MKKYMEVLKKCPLFLEIDEEKLEKMLVCLGAKVLAFDKKYTVFAEGNPAKYIGIVLSGSVQIVRMDYYGNRSLLGNAGVAEIFAESFACAQVESVPVTVIANEPSEIMFIDCSHILYTCANGCEFHKKLIFNLMKNLAVKNIGYHRKIDITSKRTTRDKLMTYLMYCAQKEGNTSFEIPFDRQELADYLEVDRSGLSVEIGKLKKEGIIENIKNRFTLL
ncbi:MAG: Crp/Fnr family transcriptional regulator [Ruminococcaceae bacterium]|nr:Crp/Fnr family transcriptional regulator [Oscillospiraceae bacterium]